MASVTIRGCAFGAVTLLNFAFVFISGADFIHFISFKTIYYNITGETILCQGDYSSLCLFSSLSGYHGLPLVAGTK